MCTCTAAIACGCMQVLAMGELIKAGKIKHWGVSNETTFGKITRRAGFNLSP